MGGRLHLHTQDIIGQGGRWQVLLPNCESGFHCFHWRCSSGLDETSHLQWYICGLQRRSLLWTHQCSLGAVDKPWTFGTTPSQTAPQCSKVKAASSQVAKSQRLVRACYRSYCTMIGQRSRIPASHPLTSRFHLFARLHQYLAPFLVILPRL